MEPLQASLAAVFRPGRYQLIIVNGREIGAGYLGITLEVTARRPMQTFHTTNLVSWVLGWSWWPVFLPFVALEIRLLWEETWLTWTQGEQMIGFTLVHVHGALFALGMLGALGTALWLLSVLIVLALTRNKLQRHGKVQFWLAAGTLLIALLPIDRWILQLR